MSRMLNPAGQRREERRAETRVRVRMPGKHIVAFAAAAAAMICATIFAAGLAARRAPHASDPAAVAGASASPAPAETTAFPEFLVDLAPDGAGRVAYLKLVAGASAGPAAATAIARNQEEIRERLLFLLRGLSADDLKGEDAMGRLKAEMLRRINLTIAPARADDVVIADIVVQ